MLYSCLKKAQNWLFPASCLLCKTPTGRDLDICNDCQHELSTLQEACEQCAHPLPASEQNKCGHCALTPPAYDHVYPLSYYESPIDTLITASKFGNRLMCAHLLGELLAERIETCYKDRPLPELIMPVPLHKSRLRERGYNQALEIARPIAKKLNIQIDTHSCKRAKATAAQTETPAKDRQRNVKNAFIVSRSIKAKHVAILDDVVTTGYTVNEMAGVLKAAGVETVEIWCCARARLIQ